MLIRTLLYTNTLPQSYRKVEELTSMSSQSRSRSKKNRKKEELIFKTNALVPKTAVIRKEEGATVAASHLPSLRRNSAGWSRKGRTGRDSPRRFNFTGNPHKIPQMSYLRNAGDFQTKQMKLKDADESENRLKTQKVTNVS